MLVGGFAVSDVGAAADLSGYQVLLLEDFEHRTDSAA